MLQCVNSEFGSWNPPDDQSEILWVVSYSAITVRVCLLIQGTGIPILRVYFNISYIK